LGEVTKKPSGRMVWTQERFAREICKLYTAYIGGFGTAEVEHNPKNNRMRAL
jgi:hypothetical protein